MIANARAGGFNLIFDADDTLWDSNIHFLEAEAAFLLALRRAGMADHVEIRASIRRHELGIIAEIGYGRRPYAAALHRAAVELLPAHHHAPIRVEVEQIGSNLLNRHCWNFCRASSRRCGNCAVTPSPVALFYLQRAA